MKVIVGLGNPGPRYSRSRHNVGFEVAQRLARRWSLKLAPGPSRCQLGQGLVGSNPVRLVLPLTMMNRSGQAVAAVGKRWKLAPAELLVVCDDVSLPLGMIRLRPGGSDGGHKGLASILEELDTQEVPRLRVGIGSAKAAGDLTDFVLAPFTAAEKKKLDESLDLAEAACEVWVSRGLPAAMNRFNVRRAEAHV
ncbi:MAG: aminoacyl-tRNA hydrolase [Candidatus Omnitrophica bacterium]|nr:aminoacyl-tRNA hydrolase [Candidatus Omnitrophota bacterium]